MSDLLPAPANSPPDGQVLIYRDGSTQLRVRLDGPTVWLSQLAIAELFQTTKQNVSLHLQNILEEMELQHEAVVKEYLTTAADGKRYRTLHYSLDAILAVGYRVRSARGTQFRQWATTRLSELLAKGFTLDDERIKAGRTLGDDYFEELLARIRDIRSSERMFYQKVTDIYATSIDYDADAALTKTFFQTVQNKLHWAAHGHTAAEIVRGRADAGKRHLGMTTWKNAPAGPVRKTDVAIAKNYLNEEELAALNRIVSAYLEFAELQASSRRPMHMADWAVKLDNFLQLAGRDLLAHAGRISHQQAEDHAHAQFALHAEESRRLEAAEPTSDFDKAVAQVEKIAKQPKALPKPKDETKRKSRKPRKKIT